MRMLRILLNIILVVALLVILAWGTATAALKNDKIQRWVVGYLVNYIEQKTQTQVQIGQVELMWPLQLRIQELSVHENNHPLFSIQRLDFACTSPRLLEGRIVCKNIHAKGVHLDRLPNSMNRDIKTESQTLESLPFHIKIKQLLIEDLSIDSKLVDQWISHPGLAKLMKDSILHIQGYFNNDPIEKTIAADLLLSIEDRIEQQPPINLALAIYNQTLSLALHMNEFPLKIASEGWEDHYADVAWHASAPISAWNGIFNTSLEQIPVEGIIKLRLTTDSKKELETHLIGSELILETNYLLTSKEQLYLHNTELTSPCLHVRGEGEVNLHGTVEGFNFTGEIKDWESLCHAFSYPSLIKGTTIIQGTFAGSLVNPSLQIQLDSQTLEIQQHTFHHLFTVLEFQGHQQSYEGNVHIDLTHEQIPYQFSSQFAWNNPKLSLKHLDFNTIDSHIHGDLSSSLDNFISEGYLEANLNNLSYFAPFLSAPLHGQADVSIHLAAKEVNKEKRQELKFEANAHQIQYDDWKLEELVASISTADSWANLSRGSQVSSHLQIAGLQHPDLAAKSLQVKSTQDVDFATYQLSNFLAEIEGYSLVFADTSIEHLQATTDLKALSQPLQGKINFAAKELKHSNMGLEELSGESYLSSNQEAVPFKLNGKGHFKETLIFALNGSWNLKEHSLRLTIDQSSGSFGSYPYQLLAPVHAAYDDQNGQKIKLESLSFLLGEGEFQTDFSLEDEKMSCHCIGKRIPSELLHFISPDIPITGRCSFDLNLNGTLNRPYGQLSIALHQIQITEEIFTSHPFIEGEINADIGDAGIGIKGILHGVGKNPLMAKGFLPIHISFSPLEFAIHKQIPFYLNFQAEGELDPYLHLFYNDTTNLAGQAKIAVTLHGNIRSPQIQGEIDLYHGSYESLSTGAIYKNINARLEGDGSRLILKHFSAEDNKQGAISALGSLQLDAANHFPFEFHIQPRQIFIVDSDYATISASGSLVLTGNQKQGKLRGTLQVDRGTIRMEQALPTQVKSVDVKYVNVPEGEDQKQALTTEVQWPLQFEIKATVPDNLIITGNRLNSEWKGDILITGTPSAPLLNGELRVNKGVYDFNGKRFNLTQGSIHFAGPTDKKTSVYIVASREIDRIIAEIIVKGPTNKLAVSFRSNPPLSQREVLSYILFNRGISDITSDQGDVLTQSFFDLNSSESSETNQTDFLSRLRSNIGIDRLDFTSSDTENRDLALQVGKYISEGIFVSVNKSINADANRVAIEAKLRKNLQAQAEVGDDAQGKILLKWKKDY